MNEHQSTEPDGDMEQELMSLGKTLGEKLSLSQRVLDELDAADDNSILPPPAVPRLRRPIGDLTMFQKLSVATLAASIALVATLWLVLSADSVSLAEVVENIRQATSYQADVRMETRMEVDGNKPSIVGKYYWRAPQDVRMETAMGDGFTRVEIIFRDKAGIEIDPRAKTYRVAAARAGASSPIMKLQNLSDFSQRAQKQLGEKSIDGSMCDGFEIKTSDIDPSAGNGTLEVWVDRTTQLPVLVEMQISDQVPTVMVFENIVWNSELNESLFSTVPPKDYKLKKPSNWSQRTNAEKLATMTSALKKFAALNGGKYPQVKVIYGDVTQAKMLELGGYEGVIRGERARENQFADIMQSTRGWGAMNQIMRENATAEYHGLEVGPEDADKVLFSWKEKDGATLVIYGDLRTAELIK